MNKTLELILAALMGSILTAVTAYIVVMLFVLQPLYKEAVDRGLASWNVVNNATGETRFAWNEIDQTIHRANPDMFEEISAPLPEK